MLRGIYGQGEQAILYANFLELSGGEPATLDNPRVTVKHLESGTPVVDVDNQLLTNIVGNEYYYSWAIPSNAYLTDYFIVYSATIDGEYAEATETLKLLSAQAAVLEGLGTHYTTKDAVVDLMGPEYDVGDVKDSFLQFVDSYIDALVQTQFRSSIVIEKYDIESTDQDTIFLKNYPVINVDYVKDGVHTIDPDAYAVYNDEGIIQLRTRYDWRLVDEPFFTRGLQEVEVKYSYGTSTVPAVVSFLATLLVADLVDMALAGGGGTDLKKETIGSYAYEYFDTGKSKRANTIKDVKNQVLYKYGNHPNTKSIQ